MPYAVETLVEKRVALITVSGIVSMAQIRAGGDQTDRLLSAGVSPVHVIIDITAMIDYPKTVSTIFEASAFLRNPHLGVIAAYGVTSRLLGAFLETLAKLSGFDYGIVNSVADGLNFLRGRDGTLLPAAPPDDQGATTS